MWINRINKIFNFKTKNINDMSFMFAHCYLLIELNLANFITTNVVNMIVMFYHCSSLKELDLSSSNKKCNSNE